LALGAIQGPQGRERPAATNHGAISYVSTAEPRSACRRRRRHPVVGGV